MEKTFVYYILLLLFLYFICQKQSLESFIQIDLSQIEEDCNALDETCSNNYTGQIGFHCTRPDNFHQYQFNTGGIVDDQDRIFNTSIGNEENQFRAIGCNEDSEPLNMEPRNIQTQPCETSNTPYRLTGCVNKCRRPDSLSDMYDLAPGKHIEDLPPYLSRTEAMYGSEYGIQDGLSRSYRILTDNNGEPILQCKQNTSTKATDVCYNLNDGSETSCRGRGDGYLSIPGNFRTLDALDQLWTDKGLNRSGNEVFAYCSPEVADRGGPYTILGCESLCNNREGLSLGSGLNEIIYKKDVDPNNPDILSRVSDDPYQESDGAILSPTNFNPNVTCHSNYEADAGAGARDDSTPEYSACPHSDGHNNYSVQGCFPSCPSDKECINFSAIYPKSSNPWLNTAPGPGDNDKDLDEVNAYKNNLERDYSSILEDSNPEKIQQLKDSLYYYRRSDPDGNPDGPNVRIETQLRCTGGADTSDPTMCELISGDVVVQPPSVEPESEESLYIRNNSVQLGMYDGIDLCDIDAVRQRTNDLGDPTKGGSSEGAIVFSQTSANTGNFVCQYGFVNSRGNSEIVYTFDPDNRPCITIDGTEGIPILPTCIRGTTPSNEPLTTPIYEVPVPTPVLPAVSYGSYEFEDETMMSARLRCNEGTIPSQNGQRITRTNPSDLSVTAWEQSPGTCDTIPCQYEDHPGASAGFCTSLLRSYDKCSSEARDNVTTAWNRAHQQSFGWPGEVVSVGENQATLNCSEGKRPTEDHANNTTFTFNNTPEDRDRCITKNVNGEDIPVDRFPFCI